MAEVDIPCRIPWIANEQLFLAELRKGRRAELSVALALLEAGLVVQVPMLRVRETVAQIPEFAQQRDLYVGTWARHHWVEVKGRALEFTDDPASYPYPTAIVDTKEGWAQKKRQPVAVVLVSQPTGARLVVPVSSQERWVEATTHDRVRDIDVVVLCAPRECLRRWGEFVEWLKGD